MKQNLYQNTHNPLLPTEHHMPDVEAHVMSDGKLYLYGSYDDCKNAYCSNAYRVASTADMKSWTVSDRVFEGGCVPWFDETADVEKTHTEPTPFIRRMQREMELHPELDYFGTTMEKEQRALLYAPDPGICIFAWKTEAKGWRYQRGRTVPFGIRSGFPAAGLTRLSF